jgi:hypothetical protein
MAMEKPIKAVCPTCKGNGYTVIPYKLAKKHEVIQCTVRDSQGEIDANKIDDIIIDSDGIHRLQ